ncbi:hypothetical protein [Thiohalocapsa marina]|nr:hypothetical protein [Thiohalocapsa marina]
MLNRTLQSLLLIVWLMPLGAFAQLGLQPLPLVKLGTCPSGYSTSGEYCVPGKQARFALEKRGTCPSGYFTSGAYCVAGSQGRVAIPKVGSCPPGWSTSGNYCLRR